MKYKGFQLLYGIFAFLMMNNLLLGNEQDKAFDLKLRWEAGQSYSFEMSNTTEITLDQKSIVQEVDAEVEREVHSHEHGKIVSTYNRRVAMRSFIDGAKKMDVDSDILIKGNKKLPDAMAKLLNVREDVILDQNGVAVKSITKEKIKGDYVPVYYRRENDSFKIVRMLAPRMKVKVGDTWEAELKQKPRGFDESITLPYTIKLHSVEEVEGALIAKVIYNAEIDDLNLKRNGKEIGAEIAELSGHYLFDVNKGIVTQLDQRTEMNLDENERRLSIVASAKIKFVKEKAFGIEGKLENVAQEADLTLKWREGKSYAFRIVGYADFDFTLLGKMDLDSEIEVRSKVERNDKGLTLFTTYERIKFKAMDVKGARDVRDTRKKGEDPFDNKMQEALKTKIGIQIDEKGRVIMPEFIEEEEDLDPDEEMLAEAISPLKLSEYYRAMMQSMPNKIVKIGESWEAKLEENLDEKVIQMTGVFTLKSITEKEGKTLAKVTFTIKDQTVERDGIKIRVTDTVGYYLFDVKLGMITRMRTDGLAVFEHGKGSAGDIFELIAVED